MAHRSIAILLVILTAIGVGCYLLFSRMKETGYEPCVLSIESAFSVALDSDELKGEFLLSEDWRYLDEDEERMLFDKFPGRTFDCVQFPEYADGSVLRETNGRIKAKRSGQNASVRLEVDDGRTRITKDDGAWIGP